MNSRTIVTLYAATLLTGCGGSHESKGAAERTTLVAPHSGASEAARAAGAESRKVIIPKIRDVPASGATSAVNSSGAASRKVIVPTAASTALVTPRSGASAAARTGLVAPHSGASEAAKAAGAESRIVTTPKIRDVPANGATSARSAPSVPTGPDPLPPGVPYASDTDPITIVSFEFSSTVFHPGDSVKGDVITSSNVASVTAQVGTFTIAVPKVAPGKFHLQMQVPTVPLPAGEAKLVITAIRTDGKRVSRDVAITIAP